MDRSTPLPFEPNTTPLGRYGAPACCQETARVSLRRTDNLGRPRRFTDPGKLRNVLGQVYAGHLRPDPHAHDDALARFDNVTVGHAWWHWPENPMGEHLIGVINSVASRHDFDFRTSCPVPSHKRSWIR